jgi:phosphoribosyl 1,2-cyclic phosphodiesterase
MKVHILGSGSSGNAIVVESDQRRIVVDAGFGVRELHSRLRSVDVEPGSVSALIVTHEHGDHGGGAVAAARRWQWPMYATAGTFTQMGNGRRPSGGTERRPVARHVVDTRSRLLLDDFSIQFVRAPHDAREHVALIVTITSTGERVGIVYDLGHLTERFVRHFADVDILLLESNYDEALLRTGPYPWSVKQRVAGPLGHLSNVEAGLMARACVHRGLRHLVLCHLSETNNRPAIALRAMKSALRGTGFRGTLTAADQDRAVTLGGAVQMELAI